MFCQTCGSTNIERQWKREANVCLDCGSLDCAAEPDEPIWEGQQSPPIRRHEYHPTVKG